MKYILYPFAMIGMLMFVVLIYAPARFIWNLIWHFKILSFRQVFTLDDGLQEEYLFDCSFKDFIKQVFIYKR